MAADTNKRPIIIKRKVSHGGHHGGAWKVAYADFVTAMMALFIVLWLLNSSSRVQKAVGGYFKDPTGTSRLVGSGLTGSGDNFVLSKDNMEQLKDELQKVVHQMPDFKKIEDHIEMTVTSEGLRVEMLEAATGTFFGSGESIPTESAKEVLAMLAQEMGKLPNPISIEGHTDSAPFARDTEYGNWELSSDRANAARRLMESSGLRAGQVIQVRGYADRRLRKPDAPLDPSNRRISVIVQHMPCSESEPAATASTGGPTRPQPANH